MFKSKQENDNDQISVFSLGFIHGINGAQVFELSDHPMAIRRSD